MIDVQQCKLLHYLFSNNIVWNISYPDFAFHTANFDHLAFDVRSSYIGVPPYLTSNTLGKG